MNIPTITGLIRRRILLNYRVVPGALRSILPANFRPKVVNGRAIAGVCLIRLEAIRPKGFPRLLGISSENAAHRIAVEWEDAAGLKEGVFIPRRDTNSRLNAWTGGRIFPGVHHYADFTVVDEGGRISMRVVARDFAEPLVEVHASEAKELPSDSAFSSLDQVSAFFEKGCIGYSSCPGSNTLDGLRLTTHKWKVAPLEVRSVRSAYFDDRAIFPAGSIEFDHALLMRDIPHEWHAEPKINVQDQNTMAEDPIGRRQSVVH